MTKKLSISKHQQVQLLEAASILCGMTDGSIPIGSVHNNQTQQSTTYLVPPNQPQESIHESTTKFRYNGSNQQQQQQPVQQQQQNDNKQRPISPSSADDDNAIDDSHSPSSMNSSVNTTNTAPTNIATSNNTSLKTDAFNQIPQPSTNSNISSTPTSTYIRKNSVSQYPPSSINIMNNTPSKSNLEK
ncbi:unnamed protein product [[Candida] boidinii]|nr:unnamed protein product [[Candida] boidinii]